MKSFQSTNGDHCAWAVVDDSQRKQATNCELTRLALAGHEPCCNCTRRQQRWSAADFQRRACEHCICRAILEPSSPTSAAATNIAANSNAELRMLSERKGMIRSSGDHMEVGNPRIAQHVLDWVAAVQQERNGRRNENVSGATIPPNVVKQKNAHSVCDARITAKYMGMFTQKTARMQSEASTEEDFIDSKLRLPIGTDSNKVESASKVRGLFEKLKSMRRSRSEETLI